MSEKKSGIPSTQIELPSKGLLYPEDHVLADGIFKFYYSTTKQEDILLSTSLIKSGEVLDVLIDSVAVDSRFNSLDVLTCDRNAMMMAIRTTLFPNGHLYNATVNCKNCNKPFDKKFDLAGLPYVELSVEPLKPRINLFSFILPISKYEIKFRLLYGYDEKSIRRFSEKNEQRRQSVKGKENLIGRGILSDSDITDRLKLMIVELNDIENGKIYTNEENNNELERVINQGLILSQDSYVFRDYINKIEPKIDTVQIIECPHCNMIWDMDIPITQEFFWPTLQL